MLPNKDRRIEGMFLIVDRGNTRGLNHWADELERRGIPALIQIDEYTLQNHLDIIRNLSERGFETGCVWNERPFWNEPYAFQYETMKRMKDRVESSIGKPMRAFSSKFFAYDAVTLQVADELGVEYILARGTAGAKGLVYKPEEYKTKIVSVSTVPFKEMGVGSLADESLRWRGVTPDEFREILFGLTEEKIILVAQSHLSGVKLHWWNAYQNFLNADIVTWKSLDEFSSHPVVLPSMRIPINTEIKYLKSEPKIPMEQEIDYPFEET
jgi:peptidoglycan/xylan/chitin deacetylase (PgdA/CDA1 family)